VLMDERRPSGVNRVAMARSGDAAHPDNESRTRGLPITLRLFQA